MRAVLLTLATVIIAVPFQTSSAQLGGLVRRAADRAIDKAADKAVTGKTASTSRPAPTFDAEVLELSSARIDQVVRGLTAWRAARTAADVPGAIRAYEAAQARSVDFSTRYTDQRITWRASNDKIENCRRGILDAQRERDDAEMERRLVAMRQDPSKMQAMAAKTMEWNTKLQTLIAAGDSAGASVAMQQMQRELAAIGGFKVDVDSSRADAQCGKPAPKPQRLVDWEANDAELRTLGARVREAEMAGGTEAVAASGLTARQFDIARERIESFVREGQMGFSAVERDALTPRRAELAAYFPAA
jgi:hypothetical protein